MRVEKRDLRAPLRTLRTSCALRTLRATARPLGTCATLRTLRTCTCITLCTLSALDAASTLRPLGTCARGSLCPLRSRSTGRTGIALCTLCTLGTCPGIALCPLRSLSTCPSIALRSLGTLGTLGTTAPTVSTGLLVVRFALGSSSHGDLQNARSFDYPDFNRGRGTRGIDGIESHENWPIGMDGKVATGFRSQNRPQAKELAVALVLDPSREIDGRGYDFRTTRIQAPDKQGMTVHVLVGIALRVDDLFHLEQGLGGRRDPWIIIRDVTHSNRAVEPVRDLLFRHDPENGTNPGVGKEPSISSRGRMSWA